MRSAIVACLFVALAACTSGGGDESRTTETSNPDNPDSACAEVRAGIDAFNDGDYDSTVIHFKRAVPLAAKERKNDPSKRADDLFEAVSWYADLPAEEYPESARSSPEFAKYKAITLGQCVPPVGNDTEPDDDDGLTT